MNTLSKKLVTLSLLTAVAVGSVYADPKKKRSDDKDPIVGPWNITLFQSNHDGGNDNGDGNEEELNQNSVPHDATLSGVFKFDPCGTLTVDGITPFFGGRNGGDAETFNGFSSTIAVGTWKRIDKNCYAIVTSAVVEAPLVTVADSQPNGSIRIRTKALIRLGKDCCVAEIFDVESRAFSLTDICFRDPLRRRFPRFTGMLCKICKPDKRGKGKRCNPCKPCGPKKGGPKKGCPKVDVPSTDDQK